jgi:hypothetical protein
MDFCRAIHWLLNASKRKSVVKPLDHVRLVMRMRRVSCAMASSSHLTTLSIRHDGSSERKKFEIDFGAVTYSITPIPDVIDFHRAVHQLVNAYKRISVVKPLD